MNDLQPRITLSRETIIPKLIHKIRSLIIPICLAVLVVFQSPAHAERKGQADTIKSGFLTKLHLFIEWPSSSGVAQTGPIKIAVVGDPKVANLIEEVSSHLPSQRRPIKVTKHKTVRSVNAVHIIFFGGKVFEKEKQYLTKRNEIFPALIVSECETCSQEGAMVNFVLANNKVVMELSRKRLNDAGFNVNERLYSVGREVDKYE